MIRGNLWTVRASIRRVLSRVSRKDQLFAAIAIVGVLAGLALLILAKLDVAGLIVVVLGILAAFAPAALKVIEPITGLFTRQRAEEDRLRTILLGGKPLPLAKVDPFEIGVFPSEIAEESARHKGAPEYVKRRLDGELEKAFEQPTLDRSGRLVVLRGDPKAGKSRTLWEAVRQCEGRRLVALRAPDPAVEASRPAAEPLSTLLSLERALSKVHGRDLVFWIDDAHDHLDKGLTRDNLRRLVERYPQAIIAATIHSARLDAIRDFDRELHKLMRQPFDELLLEARLDTAELQRAKERYPGVTEDTDLERLPELFAAVRQLIDRYQLSKAEQPVGVAVAAAAIAWQRAGMPPGSIDREALKALTKLTLGEIAPTRELTDEDFSAGLSWSMEPVAAFAALVRRSATGVDRHRAFDAVVSWAQAHEQSLSTPIWEFVLAHADVRNLNALATAARYAGQVTVAERAWTIASRSDDSQIAAMAAFNLAMLLKALGRPEEAEGAYRVAIHTAHPDLAPRAAVDLGVLLRENQRPEEANAAFRVAIDSEHSDMAARAAFNLGNLARIRELPDEAEPAYRLAAHSGHPDLAPRAAVALGALLQERERPEEAEAAYRLAIDSEHFAMAPTAAFNLGVLLEKREHPEEAEAAYRLAIDSENLAVTPAATFNLGVLQMEQGRFEDAEAAFRLAIDSEHFTVAPAAAVALGALLQERERPEEAEAAYRLAIDSENLAVAPAATFNLGVLQMEQGRFEDAEAALRVAIDSGHPDITPLAKKLLRELQEQGK